MSSILLNTLKKHSSIGDLEITLDRSSELRESFNAQQQQLSLLLLPKVVDAAEIVSKHDIFPYESTHSALQSASAQLRGLPAHISHTFKEKESIQLLQQSIPQLSSFLLAPLAVRRVFRSGHHQKAVSQLVDLQNALKRLPLAPTVPLRRECERTLVLIRDNLWSGIASDKTGKNINLLCQLEDKATVACRLLESRQQMITKLADRPLPSRPNDAKQLMEGAERMIDVAQGTLRLLGHVGAEWGCLGGSFMAWCTIEVGRLSRKWMARFPGSLPVSKVVQDVKAITASLGSPDLFET
eukprot:gnl/Dysnectes_brevis/4129_a5436_757.p1 GENE.gnl/Dysnectes_brevis/4129_a5436_757~~gnl/Dysnectes_brevis/4129_a5436_757.p1  ORF type:complete len:297 (+),score=15.97 gnl/Dysnectes_brevis/4129_a5436_757:118-1008(+)